MCYDKGKGRIKMTDIPQTKKKKKNSLLGILLAILAALTIRSCAVEPYHIPSSSMVPTLLIGDFLFISCVSVR